MANYIRVFLVEGVEFLGEIFDCRGYGGFQGFLFRCNVFGEVIKLSIGDVLPEKVYVRGNSFVDEFGDVHMDPVSTVTDLDKAREFCQMVEIYVLFEG